VLIVASCGFEAWYPSLKVLGPHHFWGVQIRYSKEHRGQLSGDCRNVMFLRVYDGGQCAKTPVIASDIHHCQNRLESSILKVFQKGNEDEYLEP
jgi:hypothetical protein